MPLRPDVASCPNSGARRPRNGGTFESIQALRGVAALLVCLFHAASHFDETQMTFRRRQCRRRHLLRHQRLRDVVGDGAPSA